jgi:hypothetical protein
MFQIKLKQKYKNNNNNNFKEKDVRLVSNQRRSSPHCLWTHRSNHSATEAFEILGKKFLYLCFGMHVIFVQDPPPTPTPPRYLSIHACIWCHAAIYSSKCI